MKKMLVTRVAVLLLALLVFASPFCMTASAARENGLSISVSSIVEANNGKKITLSFNNNTGSTVSFGWVNSCDLVVETNKGTYSTTISSVRNRIESGTSSSIFTIHNCPGKVQKITLTDLRTLDSRGLPDLQKKNAVVFDLDEGINMCTVTFKKAGIFDRMTKDMMVGVFLMGVMLVVMIVVLVLHIRKNKKARRTFQPFAVPSAQIPQDRSESDSSGFTPPPGM